MTPIAPCVRRQFTGLLLAPIVLAGLLESAGCRPQRGASESLRRTQNRPNIVLYLADTLRRDHLQVYGYDRVTSPRLSEFAADAVVFESAYATSGWTKPSVASLFSGLSATRHGAVTRSDALPGDVPVLATILRSVGYRTAAFFTNPNVAEWCGFARGFEDVTDIREITGDPHVDADTVNRYVCDYLDTDPPEPFLLYIHTMDTHGPYDPPRPYDARFTGTPRPAIPPHKLAPGLSQDELHNHVAQYDGEIAFQDEHFGLLMNDLKSRGLYENAMIIFVSDHGEEFLDHGRGGHSNSIYEELVRVPLIIKFPGNRHAGSRIPSNVGLIDVLPTLLAWIGDPVPESMDGQDLTPLLAGERPTQDDRPLFFDLNVDRPDDIQYTVSGVRWGPNKFIRWTSPEPQDLLFDLTSDPAERSNLLESQSDTVETMSALLSAHVASSTAGIQIRCINDGGTVDRIIEGALVSEGIITGLRSAQLEDGDQVELAPDARSLTFRFSLVNRPHPLGRRPGWIIDEDQFSFRIDPPEKGIAVQRLSMGKSAASLFVGAERKPADRLPAAFVESDPRLAVQDVNDFFRRLIYESGGQEAGAYLVAVPPRKMSDARIPDGLRDQLKALGYLSEDEDEHTNAN